MKFQPGDLLIRVNGEHGLHKLGQSYELVSVSGQSLSFKGDDKYTYMPANYELDPICRSPLYQALK